MGSLFDHLVGTPEQMKRNCNTECLGGLEVDGQLDLRGLHDRQVGRADVTAAPPRTRTN